MVKKSIGTSVNIWLRGAAEVLEMAGIPSARLDAEIILAHTLRKSRTWLHAHDDELLNERRFDTANARLELRKERVPVAYIIGHKEFYGRQFIVNSDVLIPRPESEDIIDLLKGIITNKSLTDFKLVDVGTGSGCLGITAKLEFPRLDVTLIDISQNVLNIAQKNATVLNADVTIQQNDLLLDYPSNNDVVIANLPYVDTGWDCSPETQHEPALALFAADNGLELIKKLLTQAKLNLNSNGVIILEADQRQHDAISQFALANDYTELARQGYILAFKI